MKRLNDIFPRTPPTNSTPSQRVRKEKPKKRPRLPPISEIRDSTESTLGKCFKLFDSRHLEAVHILRQPLEGGGGVSQKLTIADEGGRGGKPNADNC